jgi:hypothetical protein
VAVVVVGDGPVDLFPCGDKTPRYVH